MTFNFSYWERQSFIRDTDFAIIGGGLTGINTAISLKETSPESDVIVIERHSFPLGASTRNAGFACFGSVTELLSDIDHTNEESTINLLCRRLAGLTFLRKRVGDASMNYADVGGYEVFDISCDVRAVYGHHIDKLNALISERTGLQDTFTIGDTPTHFKGLHPKVIYNKYEGCLHPGLMMETLYRKASKLGVRFLMGAEVNSFHEGPDGVDILMQSAQIRARKVAICTNGFTQDLFPEIALRPARNQVLVTEKIANLPINSCFHYNEGFVYFRNIDNRILIGGGRNIDLEFETSSEFLLTDKIKKYLLRILREKLGVKQSIKIDFEWSGIMGIGETKSPILKKHGDNIIFAVRLGGMGVALGAKLGDEAAKLMLKRTTP